MKQLNKTMISIIVVVILIIIIGYGSGYYLTKKVRSFVQDIALKLSDEIGHPVTINEISTKWDWLFLKIKLNKLVVMDEEKNIPIFMVNTITCTVDALNSIVTFSPKFRHIQLQGPRLALQWDGINGPQILGLYNKNNGEIIDPAKVMQLLASQRSVSIENGDIHIQGIGDTDLPLMNVELDFKKKANAQYNILMRGGIAAATPPEFNLAINYQGKLDEYSKAMIDFDFKTSNIQIENIINMFQSYKQNISHGNFDSLDFKGAIQNGQLRFLRSDFILGYLNFEDTVLKGGSGQIEYKSPGDKLNLTLANVEVQNYKLYTLPIHVESITGDINSTVIDKQINLATDNMVVKLDGMELSPIIYATYFAGKITALKIDNKIRLGQMRKVLKLLPDKKISPDLNVWLKSGLIDGFIDAIKIEYVNGKLSSEINILQTELKYSPAWPSIKGIDATLMLHDDQIHIETTKATILGKSINYIVAEILSVHDKPFSVITIDGSIDATLENGLDFLNQSPLKSSIADKLKNFKPSGPMYLDLGLEITFESGEPIVAVDGYLYLKQAELRIPELDLALTQVTGELAFTNDSLMAKNLELVVFNQPAYAQLELSDNTAHVFHITLQTPMQVQSLQHLLPDLNLTHMSGFANLNAKLEMPWNSKKSQSTLTITSDLLGVTLSYPPPFNKEAKAILPLKLKYFVKSNDDKTVYLKLGEWMDANIFAKDGSISGGHISFGPDKALLATQDNLLVTGKLPQFDWDQWQPLLQNSDKISTLPLEVDVLIEALNFRDAIYNSVWIKYESKNNKLSLDSPIINGVVQFSKDEDKIDIKLENLDLGDTEIKNNTFMKVVNERHKDKQLPLVQFYVEKLRLKQKEYNKVSVQLLPRVYGYEITDFSIANQNILLQAQGQWQMDNKEITQLSGNAYTKDFGKALHNWGYNRTITKGDGEINFSFQWDGNPMQFDLLKLEGNSHIELRSGSITGVNPGLGRIIGLLSIESIQRRLKLDFSDLLSKGFSFDKLVCDLKLQAGVVSSDNILINSPSARIELFGKSVLKSQDLDFTMYVITKVSVGTPVGAVVALANPAVGAAIWLFDQAAGSKIGEITKYKYKVTGTWDAPKIEEIVNKKQTVNKEDGSDAKE
jgi:uncharacterized protein (TIGR02099 family)